MKNNNNDSVEDLMHPQIDEINTNMDDPYRHNVGGNMNRPVRNLDITSPRNMQHLERTEEDKAFEYIEEKNKNKTKTNNLNFEVQVENILDEIKDLLVSKNKKYGNSALEPIRVFSKSNSLEQIKVRIDDKLSRIKNQNTDEDEDLYQDLIGYLVLLKIAQNEK